MEAAASVLEAAAKVAGAEGLERASQVAVCQERGARSEEPLSGVSTGGLSTEWVEH